MDEAFQKQSFPSGWLRLTNQNIYKADDHQASPLQPQHANFLEPSLFPPQPQHCGLWIGRYGAEGKVK